MASDLDWLLAPELSDLDPAHATPVSIITGFLGAGKTTLVNRILAEQHGLRAAVIVNDFGQAGIDSELILGVEGGTISLANGCLCCEMRDDLLTAIRSILRQDDAVDAIVIEASGIAEPAGIAQTFLTPLDPGLARLDTIIAVVDAGQLPAQAADPVTADLVFGQIGYSDIVILNKIDLADRRLPDQGLPARRPRPGPPTARPGRRHARRRAPAGYVGRWTSRDGAGHHRRPRPRRPERRRVPSRRLPRHRSDPPPPRSPMPVTS